MKKGALAATAVALGAGATAGVGTAQDGGDTMVLVFGDDYNPGVDFDVAAQLDQGTKEDVFSAAGLEEEFDSPDDWDIYLINYDLGGSAPALGYLMAEEDPGDSGTMGEDGSFRNAELNLVEATPGATGDNGNGDAENGADENTTAENDTAN